MNRSITNNNVTGALMILALTVTLLQCNKRAEPGSEEHIKLATAIVDDAYLTNANSTPENWVTYGKNYAEDRFSSLTQINTENVAKLGLAWALDLETT
jgi:quinohemoprotein ethanol dehydrogenase